MENLEKKLNETKQEGHNGTKYLAVVAMASFIIALPVLYAGFPVNSHDAFSQFNLYKSFSHQVWLGELYPRWLFEMNDGFGSPTFFFYPPIAYYATTLFSLVLGEPTADAQVWQQLGFSAGAAIIASALACYWWLKDLVDSRSAAIASIIYLIIPYHVSLDLFTRGALAELWAFVWMPLVLKFVREMSQKPVIGLIGVAFSYSLLIMTHLPTTLIFSMVPVFYSFLFESGKKRNIQIILTVLGMAIGAGIADIYLLPALSARNYISMEPNSLSPLFYAKNFLFPSLIGENSPYLSYLTILLITMIAGVILCLLSNKNSALLKREWLFWIIVAFISIFMMIPLSKPVWQMLSIIQSIQFPYRFNAVLCVAFAALTAITVSKISLSKQLFAESWQNRAYATGTVILCCFWIIIFVDTIITKEKKTPGEEAFRAKMHDLRLDFVEHMPKTAQLNRLDVLIAERNKSNSPYLLRTENAQNIVSVNKWKPREIVLDVTGDTATTLTVGQFYYPVWDAAFYPDSGQSPTSLEVKASEEGLLKVQAPAGKGQLRMSLVPSSAEDSGWQTSLLSIVALIVGALILWRYKKNLGLGEEKISNG